MPKISKAKSAILSKWAKKFMVVQMNMICFSSWRNLKRGLNQQWTGVQMTDWLEQICRLQRVSPPLIQR